MAIAADHIGALLKLPLLRAALIAGACWYVLDVREIMDYKQAFKEREARIHNAIIYRHLHNNLPPDVHIVATDYFEFVNLMFYNPQLTACPWDIQGTDLATFAARKERIAVFENHDNYIVPDALSKYPYLYIIHERIQQ